MAEFTGERVVPGEVDIDLWNEHCSRYLFASRLCRNKRVLEVGCGMGYGSASLADTAQSVLALDISPEAVSYAAGHYDRPNLDFLCANATAIPLRDASVDLLVAFEMIEHLADWSALLSEARRVINPFGQFVVSTPNANFYTESRRHSGPNPYHVHEFTFEEFRAELQKHFPHVSLFVQNHGSGIVFQPVETATGAQVRLDAAKAKPEDSNFFIAVCAATPQTGAPAFVHIPSAANILRERNEHIIKLEDELVKKDKWLDKVKTEHEELVTKFRGLKEELEQRNQWADQLDAELAEARKHLDEIHAAKDAEIAEISAAYEEKVGKLEQECESQSRWAMKTQQKLDDKIKELKDCVDALHKTEQTVEERTAWAKRLDAELEELKAKISIVQSSRWVRFGKAMGIGPGSRLK